MSTSSKRKARMLLSCTLLTLLQTSCITPQVEDIQGTTPETPIKTSEEARSYAVNELLNTSFVDNADDKHGPFAWEVHVDNRTPWTIRITTGYTVPQYRCTYTFNASGTPLQDTKACEYQARI